MAPINTCNTQLPYLILFWGPPSKSPGFSFLHLIPLCLALFLATAFHERGHYKTNRQKQLLYLLGVGLGHYIFTGGDIS